MALLIYLAVYALLISATLGEVAIINLAAASAITVLAVLALAGLKAVLIALFYQHLKYEPKFLSAMVLIGLMAALSFITISLFSVHNFMR